MAGNWKKLNETLLNKTRVFDLYVQRMVFPDGKTEDDFFFIKTFDWVNVIPTTPDNRVVLVKQYRHGINESTLETPGGMVDPRDTAIETGRRELAEETGYVPKEMISLGVLHPNPAMLNNRCHVYWAKDVEPLVTQNLEPAEDISLHYVPLSEISDWVTSGRISHSIVSAALFLLLAKNPQLSSKILG